MARRYSSEYKALQPYVVEDIRRVLAAAGFGGTGGTGGAVAGSVAAHNLADTTKHVGPLATAQAPWAATKSELSAHAANPDAHHPRLHDITSALDHTVTGATWQVVGLTGTNTLGLLTPSSNVTGATKEALLKSDASGWLQLTRLILTDRLQAALLDTASGNMTVAPAADLLLSPGSNLVKVTNGKAMQSESFVSGFAGNGFRVDQGISRTGKTHIEVDDLTVRGRMSVYELLIRQIRATNGSVFVTSSAKIKRVTPIAGGYQLWTTTAEETPTVTSDTAHGFLVGDLLRAQRTRWNGGALQTIYQSNLQVTIVYDLYSFAAVHVSGDAPAAGMEFVRIGSATDPDRRGSIYLTADDTNAPFIDVVDGVASHADWNAAGKVKVRVGKLTGISGQANAYGIFSGNPATAWQSMETVNGFRVGVGGITRLGVDVNGNFNIYNSGGVPVITLDNVGNSYFAGVMTIGTGGEIRQGTGTLGSNYTGLRVWRDGNIGRIGGYSNNLLQWYANTNGLFYAGGGAVELGADGERIYRNTWSTDAPPPEPGFGYPPDLSPAAAQSLQFRDWSAFWQNNYGGFANYSYPGNTLLRMYVSSKHWVPYGFEYGTWQHKLDGVIEMPAVATGGAPGTWQRTLHIIAPLINLSGMVSITSIASAFTAQGATFTGAVYANAGVATNILTVTGGVYYSDNAHTFVNAAGSGYQNIVAGNIQGTNFGLVGGNIYKDGAIGFLSNAGAAQHIYAGAVLASNDYGHASRLPVNGIYSLGGVAIGNDGLTAGYLLDVGGPARVRSFLALMPITQPASSAFNGLLYVDSGDNRLYYLKPGGGRYVVAG